MFTINSSEDVHFINFNQHHILIRKTRHDGPSHYSPLALVTALNRLQLKKLPFYPCDF